MPAKSIKSASHDLHEGRSVRSRASKRSRAAGTVIETKHKKFMKKLKKYAKIIYQIIDCTPPKPPPTESEMTRFGIVYNIM